MMNNPISESIEKFLGQLWLHHAEKLMNQIWACQRDAAIEKFEFPQIAQSGHERGPLTLLKALFPPLFRFSTLKNRHINSVRNKMLCDIIISWKQPLELRRITHNKVPSSLLFFKFIFKCHSSTFKNVCTALYIKYTIPCNPFLLLLLGL